MQSGGPRSPKDQATHTRSSSVKANTQLVTPRQGQAEGEEWVDVASLAGFEPATRCLEGSRSVHLSYRDILY